MDSMQQATSMTLLGRLAEQVRATPQAIAVIDRQAQLTYSELAAASERIAHALIARGVRPGQALALCMPRSWHWLAAIIGVLKVGAVAVPLDRASPVARQARMLEDAGCVGLLVEARFSELPATLWQAEVSQLLEHVAAYPLERVGDPAAVSFLFYTSGSTGTPKAVEVGELGVLRLVQPGSYIDLQPGERIACLANPAFDAISFEIWAPLLNGGTCVIIADEDLLDARQLAQILERQRIDSLFMTVSLFNTLVREHPPCFASLRQVLIGGEQISAVAVRDWYRANPGSDCRIFNVYGPTECTTFALCQPIARDFTGTSVPIGRPLPDTAVRVLDEQQRPVTPGTIGELYLSGSGVAHGYRQRPEETARAFLLLPEENGQLRRHYRTGDLVRENQSGLIEYIGRADRQVKVRGFRIEPGEVEQRIVEHPGVSQAYVCTRRQAAEEHQLLAFIVPRDGLEQTEFDAYLQTRLPAYMRPQHLFLLDRLPLTANGKIDRGRLLALNLQPWRAASGEQSGTEEQGAELTWLLAQVRALLGQPQLAGQDDWLGSGGDSLKALRLRSAIRQQWQVELSMAQLLGESFAALATCLSAPQLSTAVYPPAPPRSNTWRLPATAEQRRLWLLQQREPESTAYNVPLVLHLPATIDPDALATAVGQLVERHAALRTRFVSGPDGLDQQIAEQGTNCLRFPQGQFTEDNWQAFAALVFATPFDLGTATLFQSWLLPFTDGSVRLLWHLHHSVVDGWSLNLLFDDLVALYEANRRGTDVPERLACLTPLEFGQWQGRWSVAPYYRQQRRALAQFFREQPPASAALVPQCRERGAQAGQYRQQLQMAQCQELDRFCARQRLTRFEVLFSVFAWSLHALSGLSCPRIASPVSNRPLGEFEGIVGMFANTVLIPTQLAGSRSLGDLLREQTARVRQVLALQDVALADVVEDLHLSGQQALFDFMFVLENTDFGKLDALQARLELTGPVQAKCALSLSLVDSPRGLAAWWEYQCDHFTEPQIQAAAQLFQRGLDELLETCGHSSLDQLLLPYRRSLPPASQGALTQAPFSTLADWFEHQARCTPEATALVGGEQRLSYRRLNELADSLAATLSDGACLPPLGDEPGPVLLFLEPSMEHIVALLALAKLNLTAVPLDPAYPPAVLRQIVNQSRAHGLLFSDNTESAFERLEVAAVACHRVVLDAPQRSFRRRPHQGERPLYMLFTSGSTGTPKGVQVSDRTLCNLLHWQRGEGGLDARARTLQFSMLSFDVSFQEIFSSLCGGGCYHLIVPAWRQDAPALLEYLTKADIERLFMPCVALQHLAETAVSRGIYPTHLREVVTAGEQLLCNETLRGWFAGMPQASLFNHYGPTETHVVCGLRLSGNARDWPVRAPIGRAVNNACLLLVDEDDRPVPSGASGYLLVAGPMVAHCYLGDAALNASRFVELPDRTGTTRLFYRTGDLARVDASGCLHYLGRDDQQVKLSGHRLELGQIEATLMQRPEVSVAIVTVDTDSAKLNAYLQLDGLPPTPQELDSHLARELTAPVRIDSYWRLDQWPRTPSGKVDRKALQGQGECLQRQPANGPEQVSPLQQRLREQFEAVIGRPISLDQTFFEAGATSLGLMRLHARYNQEPDLKVSMADLFEQVSIRRLAAHLASATAVVDRQPGSGESRHSAIAVIGMAVNVAGAPDLRAFWSMVRAGESGIERFDADEGLVGARSQLAGLLDFDPEYFGISRQEARLMDPHQRHLLMACVQALEHAALVPTAGGPRIGLIASCGETTYFQQLLKQASDAELPDTFQMALHHDKDFLATKAAYHLNLGGPALSVQAACGSSLIAVHMASALLRQGDADVMLAAGVLMDPTLTEGYRYRPQHIFSRDGQCRPFSDDASGTLGASGYGVVVLKPLAQAQRDGDRIYGVIEASALNNDGHDKMSYTAPSVTGQSAVIRQALDKAGLRGADIGYVEAHGTGTLLGDPIEVAALSKAFGAPPGDNCALASVKSQIGHLGAAAGVVGLIRATLAVHHGILPANLGFNRINPQIDLQHTPFYIPTQPRAWPEGRRRVAGVSSFGIGGTNAHVIVGAAPANERPTAQPAACLLISAHSRSALLRNITAIRAYREEFPQRHEALLRFLQAGRRQHRWRYGIHLEAGESWPVDEALIREVPLSTGTWSAEAATPEAILQAWYEGAQLIWPMRSAPPPWDLPPSAFDLEPYRFQVVGEQQVKAVAVIPGAVRHALPDWFYQRQWLRLHRVRSEPVGERRGTLVICASGGLDDSLLEAFEGVYHRVVQLRAGNGLRRLGANRFELDPGDARALSTLLAELVDPQGGELDWLHALPLSVSGAVNEQSLAAAQWACLDTPSALLQAWGELSGSTKLRLWLLSARACAVDGDIHRPELGALAGICEVAPQEYPLRVHWLDLPDAQWTRQAGTLAALLGNPAALPRRLAIRNDYLWQPRLIASPPSLTEPLSPLLPLDGTFLVLGGSGGIGSSLCEHLLQAPGRRVVVLSRRGELPPGLASQGERVESLQADIADLARWPTVVESLAQRYGQLAGVIHAAGVGAGNLIRYRDPRQMDSAMAAKTLGMLAVEALITRLSPRFVLYCSSMSSLLGGVGHLDYAAANGVLDGFAHYRPQATSNCVRMGINWDIWRERGMAVAVNAGDEAHQQHLAVGLSVQEGGQVFDLALAMQLPQCLLSTTSIEASRQFYPRRHTVGSPEPASPAGNELDPAGHLRECLCQWLGADGLDDEDSLYELGADSLTLLDLIDEVQTRLGVGLQLSQFSHKVSLREILTLIDGSSARAAVVDWARAVQLDIWNTGQGRDWLLLVHPVGGDVQAYRELAAALPDSLGVCVIADPLLQHPQLPAITIDQRATCYLEALQARFPRQSCNWRLAGWSFGAWVALAMCAQARQAGLEPPLLYLIDPPAPDAGQELARMDERHIEQVFQREFSQRWPQAIGQGLSEEMQAYLQRLIACCKHNMASMGTFTPPALPDTPVRLFVATQEEPHGVGRAWQAEQLKTAWQALLPRILDWQALATDHYGIVTGHWARLMGETIALGDEHAS